MNTGNKTQLQNTLLTNPFPFKPTLKRISFNDRRLSQKARKTMRKTRMPPQLTAIPVNKPKIMRIVTCCGNDPPEDPLNKVSATKLRVTKSQTIRGPFNSPKLLDAVNYP